jgi:hypothetical protein
LVDSVATRECTIQDQTYNLELDARGVLGVPGRWWLLTWGPFIGVPLLTVAVLLLLATQPHEAVQRAVKDDGIVQQASGVLMLLAVLPALYRFRHGWSLVRFETALVILVIALREWDWHRRFTGGSVTSANYYEDPANPLAMRLLAAALMVGLLAIAVHCLVSWRPRVVKDLKTLRPWAVNAVLCGIVVFAAQMLDKLTRSDSYGNTIEEVLELSAGALLIYVVWLMPSEPSAVSPADRGGPAPGRRGS